MLERGTQIRVTGGGENKLRDDLIGKQGEILSVHSTHDPCLYTVNIDGHGYLFYENEIEPATEEETINEPPTP